MVKVLKKGRKKQAFKAAKVRKSILRAAKEARVSASKRQKIAKMLSKHIAKGVRGKKTVRASDIRKAVLAHLGKQAKPAARAWRNFERRN